MKLPQDVIRAGLQRTGWEIVDIRTDDLYHWADEVWILRSVWQPSGTAYLTFLVDPMYWVYPHRKGENVYAVGVSLEDPTSYGVRSPAALAAVGKRTDEELSELLEKLSNLRRNWIG